MDARTYEFRVEGSLTEQDDADAFAELQVEQVPAGLVLRGTVVDESHLHAILARFRTLGLRLVSAQPVRE